MPPGRNDSRLPCGWLAFTGSRSRHRGRGGIAVFLALVGLIAAAVVWPAQARHSSDSPAIDNANRGAVSVAKASSSGCRKAKRRVTRARKALARQRRALRKSRTSAVNRKARKRVSKAKKALASARRHQKLACKATSRGSGQDDAPIGPPLDPPGPPSGPSEPPPEAPPQDLYRTEIMSTPGLVSYWRLGEVVGTVAADSKGDNDGHYLGGVTLGRSGALAGDLDTAAFFDGVNDELHASGTGLALGGQGTLEGWFNTESGVLLRDSTSGAAGWILAYGDAGQLAYRVAGKVYKTSRSLDSIRGAWHHIVLTKSGASTAYYIDGALVHQGSGAPNVAAVLPWRLMHSGTTSSFARGRADELAIYNSALTGEQIAEHYNLGTGGSPAPDPPPATPTGLSATAGDRSVTLDWADNSESDLAGYDVHRATSAGGPYTKLNSTRLTASGFSDTGLTNGTTYYYVVTATDAGGHESGRSSEGSATPTGPPPAPSAPVKAIWGPTGLPDGGSAFPLYEELGVDVFQLQLQWSSVAHSRPTNPADPEDAAYDWPSGLDSVISDAAAHGIQVALLVKGTPWWAVNGATQGQNVRTQAPSNSQDYANFLRAASARYPSVRRWMIWGEANRTAVWSSGPVAYANLLDAAYGALKPAPGDPDTVIGGMTFTYGETPPFDWANQMVRTNGQRPRLDEYGHNPFTRRCPHLSNGPNYLREGARDISDVDTFIGELRSRFGAHVRLWLSEFTVSSDRANRAFTFYVSRQEQADWLSKAFRIAGSVDYVSGIGWFNLHDEPATMSDGLTTGLMTYEDERKPAFDAYKDARLDGSQPRTACPAD